MNRSAVKLVVIVILILAVTTGLAVWLKSASPEKALPSPDIKGERVFVRDYSYMTGKVGAKVVLVEFGDFQCPACAAANQIVKQLVEKYKTDPDFNFVYRHFPLPQHSKAEITAQAAEAAGAQGKFFEMANVLYQNQNTWAGSINTKDILLGYASELGLDTAKFQEELNQSKYIDSVTQDTKDGEALGVNSTPTFFLNGQKLSGYLEIESKIKALLSQ